MAKNLKFALSASLLYLIFCWYKDPSTDDADFLYHDSEDLTPWDQQGLTTYSTSNLHPCWWCLNWWKRSRGNGNKFSTAMRQKMFQQSPVIWIAASQLPPQLITKAPVIWELQGSWPTPGHRVKASHSLANHTQHVRNFQELEPSTKSK